MTFPNLSPKMSLWHQEREILECAGLKDLITPSSSSYTITLAEETFERISSQIKCINDHINREYYRSYANRFLYWTKKGQITKTIQLGLDLSLFFDSLTNTEQSLMTRKSAFTRVLTKTSQKLNSIFPRTPSYKPLYKGTYAPNMETPFNQTSE